MCDEKRHSDVYMEGQQKEHEMRIFMDTGECNERIKTQTSHSVDAIAMNNKKRLRIRELS